MNLDPYGPLVAWPLMLLGAWLLGEAAYRLWRLPRACAYAVAGLVLSGAGLTQEVAPPAALNFLANVALALSLFELGYRVNPRWFTHNPWVLAAGVAQGLLTFAAVFFVAGQFGLPVNHRLVMAALCTATSPAAVMRITHELRSSGQVTERLLHLCALNCLIAVLLLKLVIGYWHLETSGDLGAAALDSVYLIALSMVAGALLGVLAPLLNRFATSSQSTTVTFALLVVLLTGVAQSAHLSPLLAALAFGAVARERRIILSHAQRDFGALGDVLSVFLFVYVASLLVWEGLLAGLIVGMAVLLTRSAAHTLVNVSLARASGTTFRKGALTGLALMPMSAFALLLLEESRLYGFDLARESLPATVGLLVLLNVLGPLATQRALVWGGESHPIDG